MIKKGVTGMLYLSADCQIPVRYCTSGKFICEDGGAVHPNRTLDSTVLLFGCEGEYCIEQNGVEYCLGPGDFMILFSGFNHKGTKPCLPGLSHYWCHFMIKEEYRIETEEEARRDIERVHASSDSVSTNLKISGRSSQLILPEFGRVAYPEKYRLLFHSLIDCSRGINVYRSRLCDLIITQLLYELSGAYIHQQDMANNKRQQSLAAKVVEYIRINATELRSVSEIADRFGYNPEYLTTLVRKSTNLSIMEHINRNKIEEAKKLLLSTNLTIAEITLHCGFTDPKYFSRLFHRMTDTTPSEYRNAYFKIHTNQ